MFQRKKQPPIKSLIAHGCHMAGNFSFAEGLRLDGSIDGNITGQAAASSILVISESAVVTGDIQADHIIVNGRIQGQVHARNMLELQPKAQITGDVTYKALEMHHGAIVAGRLCPLLAGDLANDKPPLAIEEKNA